jgi:hypothetical protein
MKKINGCFFILFYYLNIIIDKIIKILNQETKSNVYEVEKTNKFYALKKVGNKMFNQEIFVNNMNFSSPYLLKYHDCFVVGTDNYLLMDIMRNGTLVNVINKKSSIENNV